jgi:DNA-directed RNA polymerase specialized sigma24 family protein
LSSSTPFTSRARAPRIGLDGRSPRARVAASLRRLGPRARVVLALLLVECLSAREAAAALGMSAREIGNVRRAALAAARRATVSRRRAA